MQELLAKAAVLHYKQTLLGDIMMLRALVALALLTPGTFAIAGGASTGGGGAFVCRAADGSIVDAELLDLWEGRERRKWNIPYTNESVEVQIKKALTKLKKVDPILFDRVVSDLNYVRGNVEYLPASISIQPPHDAQNGYFKTDCPLEGMMLFDGETQKLSMKHEIFSKLMNNTNVAAAWMHEAVYKSIRDAARIYTSQFPRKIVACLFSQDNCFGIGVPPIPPSALEYRCNSKTYSITAYTEKHVTHPNGAREFDFQGFITRINGYMLATPVGIRTHVMKDYKDNPAAHGPNFEPQHIFETWSKGNYSPITFSSLDPSVDFEVEESSIRFEMPVGRFYAISDDDVRAEMVDCVKAR